MGALTRLHVAFSREQVPPPRGAFALLFACWCDSLGGVSGAPRQHCYLRLVWFVVPVRVLVCVLAFTA